jgi:hypothetical protein
MGYSSTASGDDATAIGGTCFASGKASLAMGGYSSRATGYMAIAIGSYCVAEGENSFAIGYGARANHQGAFVWADSRSSWLAFGSSANDQFLIRASGGVGINTTNPATALDVKGTITATGIRAGFNGTVQSRVQFGTATVGTGVAGANVFTMSTK